MLDVKKYVNILINNKLLIEKKTKANLIKLKIQINQDDFLIGKILLEEDDLYKDRLSETNIIEILDNITVARLRALGFTNNLAPNMFNLQNVFKLPYIRRALPSEVKIHSITEYLTYYVPFLYDNIIELYKYYTAPINSENEQKLFSSLKISSGSTLHLKQLKQHKLLTSGDIV
ncbi:hypothetical protein ACFX5K_06200 [Rickettsiales bacterium LUAb2]